jgi:hypothetical protein
MSEITLIRTHDSQLSDQEKQVAKSVLFGKIDGLGEIHKKRWRTFMTTLLNLEPGEMVTIKTNKPREGWFHRRHMLMEQRVFESQERFENFEKGFRDWLKVGAGHCDWHPGPKGGVFPVPKSISYSEIEEGEMREFHDASVAFLRSEHAQKTLWPHLDGAARSEMMELILKGFD